MPGQPKRGRQEEAAAERTGVQSVVIAARVLKALAACGGIAALKELAAATGMPRAKVHRYLGSLCAAGLVGQDAQTGRYHIAAAAVTIGLVGLRRISPVRQLQDMLPRLRDAINETVTAAVWGESGPTIIAIEESEHLVTMNLRIGSVLPVLNTAIGRLFLAHLPPAITKPVVAAERRAAAARALPSGSELDALLQSIRRRRLSHAHGVLIPGVDAIAAPVFDHRDRMVGALCVVGHSEAGVTGWNAPAAKVLREAATELSARLGASPFAETAGVAADDRSQAPAPQRKAARRRSRMS
jgi:DNA-binding IclR family transcriptional regulator